MHDAALDDARGQRLPRRAGGHQQRQVVLGGGMRAAGVRRDRQRLAPVVRDSGTRLD